MRKISKICYQLFMVACTVILMSSCTKEKKLVDEPTIDPFEGKNLSNFLGVTHWGSAYHLTNKPILTEGADQLEELGTKIIKLAISKDYRTTYFYNSSAGWTAATSMKELLQTAYFQDVLSRSFTVYVFVASEFNAVNWKDGLSQTEATSVESEFYEVTKHLLNTYANTGKTFVFQNWEGDNLLNIEQIAEENQGVAIQGMIDWLNTRQKGVSRARAELGDKGTTVACAAELNFAPPGDNFQGRPLMVDEVLPHTNMDLYSLSSWGTKSAGTEKLLVEKMDYIKSKVPASQLYGRENIYLGEFGCYEAKIVNGVLDDYTDEYQRVIVKNQIKYAYQAGYKWAIYWQLYSNGLLSGVSQSQGKVYKNNELVGVWLIRADSTLTSSYKYFKDLLNR